MHEKHLVQGHYPYLHKIDETGCNKKYLLCKNGTTVKKWEKLIHNNKKLSSEKLIHNNKKMPPEHKSKLFKREKFVIF